MCGACGAPPTGWAERIAPLGAGVAVVLGVEQAAVPDDRGGDARVVGDLLGFRSAARPAPHLDLRGVDPALVLAARPRILGDDPVDRFDRLLGAGPPLEEYFFRMPSSLVPVEVSPPARRALRDRATLPAENR